MSVVGVQTGGAEILYVESTVEASVSGKTFYINRESDPLNKTNGNGKTLIARVTYSDYTTVKETEPMVKIWVLPTKEVPSNITTIHDNESYYDDNYLYYEYRKG